MYYKGVMRKHHTDYTILEKERYCFELLYS